MQGPCQIANARYSLDTRGEASRPPCPMTWAKAGELYGVMDGDFRPGILQARAALPQFSVAEANAGDPRTFHGSLLLWDRQGSLKAASLDMASHGTKHHHTVRRPRDQICIPSLGVRTSFRPSRKRVAFTRFCLFRRGMVWLQPDGAGLRITLSSEIRS